MRELSLQAIGRRLPPIYTNSKISSVILLFYKQVHGTGMYAALDPQRC